MDEPGNQSQSQTEAARRRQQDRLSRQVARLLQPQRRPRGRPGGTLCAPRSLRTIDSSTRSANPPTVDAYYNPSMNDINFPAGILQSPFFDPNSPEAANYGHIGAIVGHELTHGFDDQGRKFDGKGNLAEWWTAEDAKQFNQKTDCEVTEYGQFSVPGDVKLNGKLTLGENTADNGGLRLGYLGPRCLRQ